MQGKREDEYKNSGRIFMVAVVGLFFTIVGMLVFSECSGQVGYYVVIDRDAPTRFVKIEKTMDTAEVNVIFKDAFNLDDFSIVESMDSTGVFDAMNADVWIYCEERLVVRNRNGKLKYKKMRERFKREFLEADSVFWGSN